MIGSLFPFYLLRRKSNHKALKFNFPEFCSFPSLISYPFLIFFPFYFEKNAERKVIQQIPQNTQFLLINVTWNSGSFIRQKNYVCIKKGTHSIWIQISCDVLTLILRKLRKSFSIFSSYLKRIIVIFIVNNIKWYITIFMPA